MSGPPATEEPAWPGDDPYAIAIASRIVLLTAVATTSSFRYQSDDLDLLLSLISRETSPALVGGRPFSLFFEHARDTVLESAGAIPGLVEGLADTVRAVAESPADDVLKRSYLRLAGLSAPLYQDITGAVSVPELRRSIIADYERTEHLVTGRVSVKRDTVTMLFYPRFDLEALILSPFIMAHELICHIGSRHIGEWRETPRPNVQRFFEEGFMDKAAWYYLMLWLEDEHPELTATRHLDEEMIKRSSPDKHVFSAGKAAWDHCEQTLRARCRQARRYDGGPTDFVAQGALTMNVCAEDIRGKDWFVFLAHEREITALDLFAQVALGSADPLDLITAALGNLARSA